MYFVSFSPAAFVAVRSAGCTQPTTVITAAGATRIAAASLAGVALFLHAADATTISNAPQSLLFMRPPFWLIRPASHCRRERSRGDAHATPARAAPARRSRGRRL